MTAATAAARAPALPAVHVVRRGAGPVPALLLHCSLAHSGAWNGMLAAMGDRWTATAFDHPGHGRSADWDGSEEINTLSTRIARDLLPAEPADVVGHSFGGSVALRLALEQPRRVRRLILIEPVLFAAARAAGAPAYAENAALLAGVAADLARGDRTAALRRFLAVWSGGAPFEALAETQRRYMAERIHLIPAGEAALDRDVHGLTRPERLAALDVPVLLVEGAASPAVVAAIHAALAAHLPRVRRVVVAGAGHMLPITHPGAVAAAVADFLDAPP